MSSINLLQIANTLVKRVFTDDDPFSVVEVSIKDYVNSEILNSENSLTYYKYSTEDAKEEYRYEIVLQQDSQSKNAFRIYRSTNREESKTYFAILKDKIPTLLPRIFAGTLPLPNLIIQSLLEDVFKYINSQPSQNIAHVCAYYGYEDYFLKTTEIAPETLNFQDDNQKTPLMIAIEKERLSVVKNILKLSPDLKLVDEDGDNVFHYAVLVGPEYVAALCNIDKSDLKVKAQMIELMNSKNHNSFTPLYLACQKDKSECVKELLKNGANVNSSSLPLDQDFTVKSESLSDQNLDTKWIAKLNDKDMKNGGTPLHWCKSTDVIDALLKLDVNVNAKNFIGDSTLHVMIGRANISCVIALLSHGADVNATDANGNTALHLAIKSNDIALVQSVIVFGANLDIVNQNLESARHFAATSTQSPAKDVILYMLDSISAKRCSGSRKLNCSEGCSPNFHYNGVPPNNPSFLRNSKMFSQILNEEIVKNAVKNKKTNSSQKEGHTKIKLLSMDGGGIRGLILIQILTHLEKLANKPIVEMFDWIAGTSTGGILALLLASGFSASDCRQIYFRLKDELFVGFRPYSSETLEKFLQKYLGNESKMKDLTKPKIMVTATMADKFPPDIKLFRNYCDPEDVLNSSNHSDRAHNHDLKSTEEFLWKVGRATGAAPTYFAQFDYFIDGGLVSNNPSLDLLTEVQVSNRVNQVQNKETLEIDLMISLGTGQIPSSPLEKLNFAPLASLSALSNLASSLGSLMKVLVEQASQSDGQVVKRAEAWCSAIEVPYFRINPPISADIQMNETDNAKLVNMLWETLAYLNQHKQTVNDILTLVT